MAPEAARPLVRSLYGRLRLFANLDELGKGAAQPPVYAALSLLLVLTAAAVAWPVITYDNWLYHLPFSARQWGIGSAGSFEFGPFLQARWDGFPKAWNWVQGAFWWAAGDLRWIMVPTVLLCLGYFVVVARVLQVRRSLLILGFFASPMLITQYQSPYLDLPAAVLLALGFFLLAFASQSGKSSNSWHAVLGACALGFAGNVKVQAWLAVFLICAVLAALELRPASRGKRMARLWPIAAALMLSSITGVSNYLRTGNPVYPNEVRIADTRIFPGPENPLAEALPPRYEVSGRLIGVPQPVGFALSVSELDWTMRGVVPRYNLDSNTGDDARNGPSSRTGGWGWLFVLLNGCLLAFQLVRFRQESDGFQRMLVVSATALLILTAFLPRSHELRYWLFLPLIVMPLNIRYAQRSIGPKATGWLLMVAATYALAQTVLSPTSNLLFNRPPLPDMATFTPAPRALGEAVAAGRTYCDEDPILFRYSAAVTGKRVHLSQRPEDCPQGSQ